MAWRLRYGLSPPSVPPATLGLEEDRRPAGRRFFQPALRFGLAAAFLVALAAFGAPATFPAVQSSFQRVRQVEDVAACRGCSFGDRKTALFLFQKISQCRFMMIFKLRRIEVAEFRFNDVFREVEHFLGDLHVFDVFEIF
jgi:hypothetical protein